MRKAIEGVFNMLQRCIREKRIFTLAEVRAFGSNPLQTRRRGLVGKQTWHAMCNRLEQLRNVDGRIPLTLEIIYGHAFKPIPQHKQPNVSVIHFDRLNRISKPQQSSI